MGIFIQINMPPLHQSGMFICIKMCIFYRRWAFHTYKHGCTVVMSKFFPSKWQRVALPTRWRASVRTLFYCYLTFLDQRTNISRKVHAPRRVSTSGAPNKFQNCHLDKTNMDKTSQHPNMPFYTKKSASVLMKNLSKTSCDTAPFNAIIHTVCTYCWDLP